MAPETIARYSEQIVFAYILILGIAATVTSFKDVVVLALAGLRNSSSNSSRKPVGDSTDAEQENSSN